MYFTSGGEGKLYFVLCFNKSSNIYIYILNLYLISWAMAWWYSPCLGPWDFKKVKGLCVQTHLWASYH